LRPPKFNIFQALGCTRSEGAHSSLLTYFLDPCGDHGQGVLFLKSFLELIRDTAKAQQKNLVIALPEDSVGWICSKEVMLKSLGRADIRVWGKNLVAVIENKLFAGDQEEQLVRYWTFLESVPNIPTESKILIYLTPDGKAPSERSVKNNLLLNEHLILLSYKSHLSGMFQKIVAHLEENKLALPIVEDISQYISAVRRLT